MNFKMTMSLILFVVFCCGSSTLAGSLEGGNPIAVITDATVYYERGDTITLGASSSFSPDDRPLSYQWIVYKPDSTLEIVSTTVSASFTVSLDGVYRVVLTVFDGLRQDKASSYLFVSPSPAVGHDLELYISDMSSYPDPGQTASASIYVKNKGQHDENIKARLTVFGPGIDHRVVLETDLGQIEAGSGKSFTHALGYTVPEDAEHGYYAFIIHVYSESGDENWKNNTILKTVRVGDEEIVTGAKAFEIKSVYLSLDLSLELWHLAQPINEGGFGWQRVTIPYNGENFTYYIALGVLSYETSAQLFIKSNHGFQCQYEPMDNGEVVAWDGGKIMVSTQYEKETDHFLVEVAFPIDDDVTITPYEATVERGSTRSYSYDFSRNGASGFDPDTHFWEYDPDEVYRFDIQEAGFNDVVNVVGTALPAGYELQLTPQSIGRYGFIARVPLQNMKQYYVTGIIDVTEPLPDRDSDGIPDTDDKFPDDPAASVDSDNDGFPDYWNSGKTEADSTTGLELDVAPDNPDITNDSDKDGMPDVWEDLYGLDKTNPNDASGDPDSDQLTNLTEYQIHTNPGESDSDSDEMPDGWEYTYGLNPVENDADSDLDNDSYTNSDEYMAQTRPNDNASIPILPVPDAGEDKEVTEGDLVDLVGTETRPGSYRIVSWQWTQTSGLSVDISDSHTSTPSFVAPVSPTPQTVLSFSLEITTNTGATYTDTCTVTVLSTNKSPEAYAGNDRLVLEGRTVTLNGSGSSDDKGIAMYHWTQQSGPEVVLSANNVINPTFVAPLTDEDVILSFDLTVEDELGFSSTDRVDMTVTDDGISEIETIAYALKTPDGRVVRLQPDKGNPVFQMPVDASFYQSDDSPENMVIDVVSLKLKLNLPGDTTHLDIYLPEALPVSGGESFGCYIYSAAKGWKNFDEHGVIHENRDKVTLTLTDGDEGDDDGIENSEITIAFAIGTPAPEINDFKSDSCFIGSM